MNAKRARIGYFFLAVVCLSLNTHGSETNRIAGIRTNTPAVHAFIHAQIVVEPGREVHNGTLVIRDGLIESVKENSAPPADARIWDCTGLRIYPGLVESYSQHGLRDGYADSPAPRYGNPRIRPERTVPELFSPSSADYAKLREAGFTTAMLVPREGILCGQSTLVSLAEGDFSTRIIKDNIAQILNWTYGGLNDYPSSHMGAIALLRQSLLDARWYKEAWRAYERNTKQAAPETNLSLAALQPVIDKTMPLLFDSLNNGNLGIHRLWQVRKIAQEFDLDYGILGNGFEYRELTEYKNEKGFLILPLNFPEKPNLETYEEALEVNLTAMRHWDWAPSNPRILHEADINFCLTTFRLDQPTDFFEKVQQAIERGLPADIALAALTTRPARQFGVDAQIGTLHSGKRADFIITDGELFAKKTKRLETWIGGQQYILHKQPDVELAGLWDITFPLPVPLPDSATMEIKGEASKLSGSITPVTESLPLLMIESDHRRLSFSLEGEKIQSPGVWQFSGLVQTSKITGYGTKPDGDSFPWSATRRDSQQSDETDTKEDKPETWHPTGKLTYPPNPWGRPDRPTQEKIILIKNATIWTSGPRGILTECDLLIENGIIQKIEPNIPTPGGAYVIDAQGMHVTPGILDCHQHTSIDRGVNEVGHVITAETRIEDVLNSYDVHMYLELAGGVTTAHTMHGSANPIGGQCATYKLKWGRTAPELLFKEAPTNLKLALGENPKRVWGNSYPHSRIGVIEIIRDRFKAAQDYQQAWKDYTSHPETLIPPRRDLELEALAAVLDGKSRMFTHAYRQDEILAHIRLAQEFGVHPGNYQHGLECYKVADIMAQTNAQATTFSDWWMYKLEVYDAIPYNAALLHSQGVSVTLNSDSDEMSRRLNTEAAKAVKYGGLSEIEALNLVTIETARQLQIDQYVGSLEPGKHGDFALWSGHPLSTYSRCEQTWIEGTRYFDRQEDIRQRQAVNEERAKLVQRLLGGNSKSKDAEPKPEKEMSQEELNFWFSDWRDANVNDDESGLRQISQDRTIQEETQP